MCKKERKFSGFVCKKAIKCKKAKQKQEVIVVRGGSSFREFYACVPQSWTWIVQTATMDGAASRA